MGMLVGSAVGGWGGSSVSLGLCVDVGGSGSQTSVLVGATVLVTKIVLVGMAVGVVASVAALSVSVGGGSGVRVTKLAPGVNNTFAQAGWVRMAGSTGSKKPTGLRVRNS